jgi:glycosyltransferase involved in cell wall biosynthesis
MQYSVIMPVWPDEVRPYGLDYIDKVDWSRDDIEVILSHGLGPCRQRNEAAQEAKGDILVFFDNDSCPEREYFRRLIPHYDDPSVAGVGGPNPGEPTSQFIPNLVEAVFHNPFILFGKQSRYKPTGNIRQGGDSDFIFCNFTMRRDIYLAMKGLDERLCPNEENEFFERFFRQFPDKKLIYDPQLIAYEPRPDTLRAFLKKMNGYGKGRARQFKVRPGLRSLFHIFAAAALFLPILAFLLGGLKALAGLCIIYGFYLSVATLYSLITFPMKKASIWVGLASSVVHCAYFLGIWKGLLSPLGQGKDFEVVIERYDLRDIVGYD